MAQRNINTTKNETADNCKTESSKTELIEFPKLLCILLSLITPIDSFSTRGNINDYRIASFLLRDGKAYAYGEDSAIRDYSYIYSKLITWMLVKFNYQLDEGPAENIHQYLLEAGKPEKIMVSIGATRYTEYGEKNFLHKGDHAVVVLYPESKYTFEHIVDMLEKNMLERDDISVLNQEIVEG